MNGTPTPATPVNVWSLLIVADATRGALQTLAERVDATGAACWTLDELVDGREAPALVDAVLLDIRNMPAPLADGAVQRARDIADDRGLPVVAVIDAATIDLAAAALLGRPHQLLCEPGDAEIMVALVSARSAPKASSIVASDESERLRQLSSEVARIAETLARLTRSELDPPPPPSTARDRHLGFGMPPIESGAPIEAREVRNLIRARRMRDNQFAADLFADPAWDMLLDLFAAELEHRRVSVSSLCIAAAVPGTTALRWIGTMVDVGLFERHADPFDRRRAYIALTDRARDAMTQYFDSVRRAGLSAG